jgi:hypothetical protein
LVLALMSRKPENLSPHVSAGVEICNPFRKPIRVEVNGEGHVELVLQNDSGGKATGNLGLVEVNESY